jgi:hypothetical protein
VDLEVLTETIDRLNGSEPFVYTDAESIEVLHGQLARLEAFVSDRTAGCDAAGNWMADGARSAAMWLPTQPSSLS